MILQKTFKKYLDWTRYIGPLQLLIRSDMNGTGMNKIDLVFTQHFVFAAYEKIGIGTLTWRKWIADNLCFIIEINDKHLKVFFVVFFWYPTLFKPKSEQKETNRENWQLDFQTRFTVGPTGSVCHWQRAVPETASGNGAALAIAAYSTGSVGFPSYSNGGKSIGLN